MSARKTVPVADVRDIVNRVNEHADMEHATAGLTPTQAFRLGADMLLERILHETGNYRGFRYVTAPDKPDHDPTRRFYYP